MITVAMTAIMLDIIWGKFKPSGACRMYPTAIKVHTAAGASAIMYCFFFFIRYADAAKSTIVATINWDHAKYLQIRLKSTNVNPNDIKNNGNASFNLDIIFSLFILNSSTIVILALLSAVSPVVIGQITTPIMVKIRPTGPTNTVAISLTATAGAAP